MNNSQSDSELSESFDADDSESGSSSSSSSSSSSYATTQTDEDEEAESQAEDAMELVKIGNALLRLPRDLCENVAIFQEFFSLDTWNMLPLELQQSLSAYLPDFSQFMDATAAELEKQRTLQMLFSNELNSFGYAPLQMVQQQLETGNYRPDVVKLRKSIAKSRRREHRFQTCERLSNLARELFVHRERLLRSVYKSSPAATESAVLPRQNMLDNLKVNTKMYVIRAQQRYAQELDQLIRSVGLQPSAFKGTDDDLSSSESAIADNVFDNQQPMKAPSNTSNNNTDKSVYGTLFKRRHGLTDEDALFAQQHAKQPRLSHKNVRQCLLAHKRRKLTEPNLPEFDIGDIRLRDVCTRAQMSSNFRRIFASNKATGRKAKNTKPFNETIETNANELTIDEVKKADYEKYTNAQQVFYTANATSSIDSLASDMQDAYDLLDADDMELQQEEVVATNYVTTATTAVTMQQLQQSQVSMQNVYEQTKLASINAKDNHNYPSIPIHNANTISCTTTNGSLTKENVVTALPKLQPLQNISMKSGQLQTSPACFFSLVRDLFCETTHHRLQLNELVERIEHWFRQSIFSQKSNNHSWYGLAESWPRQLPSAIEFLTGEFSPLPEEYVPYLEYKSQTNIYQWIGAGRDSDMRLTTLCNFWLQRRKPTTTITKIDQNAMSSAKIATNSTNMSSNTIHITITTTAAAATVTGTTYTTTTTTATAAAAATTTSSSIKETADGQAATDNIPPARCTTTWTVRCATAEEIKEFQRQERERFEQPHRAYTYRMHGYESVVGPVKGIYSQIYAMTKARGHSMMVGDRPNFVTILTLVRDAVARLPNGEGTRADIAELVKSSQYLNHNAAENVLQTIVSGALDRMHTETDPCVRYDPKRKIWIYLHRHRSEQEFEQIHQQQQAAGRTKKPARKSYTKKIQINSTTTVCASTATTTATVTTTAGINNRNLSSQPPPLTSVSDGACLPLPALVPANNTLTLYNQQQQQQMLKQKQILLKCPPVPPLKYHVPPNAQQQKSLLKLTRASGDANDNPVQQKQQQPQQQQQQRVVVRTVVNSASSTDVIDTKKSQQIQQQQQFALPRTLSTKLNSKTPILVATPNGLQAVQVSNTASAAASNSSGIIVTPTALNANLAGKKLSLKKPIIINQITTSTANNTNYQQQQQQASRIKTLKQQQTQSFLLPLGDALVHDGKTPQTSNVQAMYIDNNGQLSTIDGNSYKPQQQQQQLTQQQQQNKNVIRLLPAGTNSATASGIQQQKRVAGTPVQIVRQQKVSSATTATSASVSAATTTSVGGISIIAANKNSTGVGTGTIVKMTPQAFAVFQQQQQQQKQPQQHIVLKTSNVVSSTASVTTQQPPRLVVGNTAILTGQQQGLLQSLTPIVTATAGTTFKPIATTLTSVINSQNSNISGVIGGGNIKKGVQTITATSLSPQQQRILLQNLKQQKQKQQNDSGKTTTFTAIVSPTQNKTQQQSQTVTRFIKTSTAELQHQHLSNTIPTKILTSAAGQIISLEDLLQKQRNSNVITTVSAAGKQESMPQIVTLTGCTTQQQKQQFGIVVSPTTRGTISLNAATNAGTTGTMVAPMSAQRLANSAGTTILTTKPTTTTLTAAKTPTTINKTIISGGRVITMTSASSNNSGNGSIVSSGNRVNAVNTFTNVGNNIRIINTAGTAGGTALTGLNFANLQGKQVVFATKQQQQQLQSTGVVIGGQTVKLQPNVNLAKTGFIPQSGSSGTQLQTVIVGNQILRVQQLPGQTTQALKTTGSGGTINRLAYPLSKATTTPSTTTTDLNLSLDNLNNETTSTGIRNDNSSNLQKTLVLGNSAKTMQLHTSPKVATVKGIMANTHIQHTPTAASSTTTAGGNTVLPATSRVVLAVQSGAPIILPSGTFQGGTINLKSLQNMKLVSLAPTTNTTSHTVKEATVLQPQASLQ